MKMLFAGGAAALALAALAPATAQTQAVAATAPGAAAHHVSSRVHTRAEVVAKVREHFARKDSNRDGVLTKEEAGGGAGHMGHMGHMGLMKMDRGAMFERMDTNRDNMISRAEFDAAAAMRHEKRVVKMKDGGNKHARMGGMPGFARMRGHMFEMADLNRDGRVTMQEATDSALRHFDSADLNRDGQLSTEERRQARERMRAERKRS